MGVLDNQDGFIDSAQQVRNMVKFGHNLEVSLADVYYVLKKELNMSFKKIKPIAIHANSDKNLIIR